MKMNDNLVLPRPIRIPFDEEIISKLVNTILKRSADHIFSDHDKEGSSDNLAYNAVFSAIKSHMQDYILEHCKKVTPHMDLKDIPRAVLFCIDALVNIDGRRIICNKYANGKSYLPNVVPYIEYAVKAYRTDNPETWSKINWFLNTIRRKLERTINYSYTEENAFQAWIDDDSDTGGKDTYATDDLSKNIESFTCRNVNTDRTFFFGKVILRYNAPSQYEKDKVDYIVYTYKARIVNHEIIALAIFSPEGKILYEQGEGGKVIQQPYDTYVATVKDELIRQLSKCLL